MELTCAICQMRHHENALVCIHCNSVITSATSFYLLVRKFILGAAFTMSLTLIAAVYDMFIGIDSLPYGLYPPIQNGMIGFFSNLSTTLVTAFFSGLSLSLIHYFRFKGRKLYIRHT